MAQETSCRLEYGSKTGRRTKETSLQIDHWSGTRLEDEADW
jgi:hypothetical protein